VEVLERLGDEALKVSSEGGTKDLMPGKWNGTADWLEDSFLLQKFWIPQCFNRSIYEYIFTGVYGLVGVEMPCHGHYFLGLGLGSFFKSFPPFFFPTTLPTPGI
jgi:hypothetical protein